MSSFIRTNAQTLAIVTILVVLAFLPFMPALARGDVINSGDVRTLYVPYFLEARRQLAEGQVPLWYNGAALGLPLTTLVDAIALHYPVTQLLLRLPDPYRAFMLDYPIHFLLAGLGLFGYLRVLGVGRWPALAGCMVMMLSGYMFHRIIHPSQLRPVAYLPAVLLCLELAMRRSWLYFLAAGALFGLLVLGAHPQPILYTLLASAAYVIWRALAPPRQRWPLRLGLGLAGLVVAVGIGLGLGAVQLLPMLELYPHSDRSVAQEISFFGSSALDFRNLPLVLFPLLYGQPAAGTFWGSPYDHGSLYVGVLPLVVLPFALRSRRRREAWFFAALAAFGVLAALGTATPLGRFLFRLPVLNAFRAPLRFLMYYSVGLAVLTALGVEALALRPAVGAQGRRWRALVAVGAAASLAGAAVTWLAGDWLHQAIAQVVSDAYAGRGWVASWLAFDHAGRANYHLEQLVHAPATIGQSLWLFGLLLGLAAALLALRPRLGRRQFALAAALLAGADLLVVSQYNAPLHTLPASYFEVRPASLRALPEDGEPFRLLSWDGRVFRNGHSPFSDEVYGVGRERVHWWDGDGADPELYLRERAILPPITSLAFGLESFNTYGGLRPQAWHVVRDLLDDTSEPGWIGHRHLLDLLNIRYVLSSVPLENTGLRLVQAGEVNVYENLRARPRAFLAESWTVVADDDAALEAIRQPGFDPTRAVITPAGHALPAVPPAAAQPGSVTLLDKHAGRLVFQVETAAPALLVVGNWHYPGWRAEVRGQAAPVLRANYLLQAVFVEAGSSTVELSYEPASVWLGSGISMAVQFALGLAAGMLALQRLARQRLPKPARSLSSVPT